jgi:hypothetical protein
MASYNNDDCLFGFEEDSSNGKVKVVGQEQIVK